jgi:hypothetical protein
MPAHPMDQVLLVRGLKDESLTSASGDGCGKNDAGARLELSLPCATTFAFGARPFPKKADFYGRIITCVVGVRGVCV